MKKNILRSVLLLSVSLATPLVAMQPNQPVVIDEIRLTIGERSLVIPRLNTQGETRAEYTACLTNMKLVKTMAKGTNIDNKILEVPVNPTGAELTEQDVEIIMHIINQLVYSVNMPIHKKSSYLEMYLEYLNDNKTLIKIAWIADYLHMPSYLCILIDLLIRKNDTYRDILGDLPPAIQEEVTAGIRDEQARRRENYSGMSNRGRW